MVDRLLRLVLFQKRNTQHVIGGAGIRVAFKSDFVLPDSALHIALSFQHAPELSIGAVIARIQRQRAPESVGGFGVTILIQHDQSEDIMRVCGGIQFHSDAVVLFGFVPLFQFPVGRNQITVSDLVVRIIGDSRLKLFGGLCGPSLCQILFRRLGPDQRRPDSKTAVTCAMSGSSGGALVGFL